MPSSNPARPRRPRCRRGSPRQRHRCCAAPYAGSCSGSEWVDFKLELTAADYHYNYLLEVEDLTALAGHPSPTALSLHLFGREIPPHRSTDYTADRAVDGMYSIAINRHNFREGPSGTAG